MSVNNDDITIRIDHMECRICYENTGELFRPCTCRSYVHRNCLQQWISTSTREQCEVCHYKFIYEYSYPLLWITEWYIYFKTEIESTISRFFHLFLMEALFLNVISGIVYGIDSGRLLANKIGIHDDRDYRGYYLVTFIVFYILCELSIWIEFIRMSLSQKCRYIYMIICRIKVPHVIVLVLVGYSTILYATVRTSVFLDIPVSLLFLFSHYEIHILAIEDVYHDRTMRIQNYPE